MRVKKPFRSSVGSGNYGGINVCLNGFINYMDICVNFEPNAVLVAGYLFFDVFHGFEILSRRERFDCDVSRETNAAPKRS